MAEGPQYIPPNQKTNLLLPTARSLLPTPCCHSLPPAACSAVWFKHSNSKRGNLRTSVEAAGLEWEGRAHSAIDDARNTARWVE